MWNSGAKNANSLLFRIFQIFSTTPNPKHVIGVVGQVLAVDLVTETRQGTEVELQPQIFQAIGCGPSPAWANEAISLLKGRVSTETLGTENLGLAMHHQDGQL